MSEIMDIHTQLDTVLDGLLNKFSQAATCWYSSVRANGRVHLAPIWHVWLPNAVYVVTQPTAVRAQNLVSNSSVSLALPDPMNVLIIEGVAKKDETARDRLRPLFQAKYQWDIATDGAYTTIIRIDPIKLLAWGEHGTGRWRFDASQQQWSQYAAPA
jgi:Pyridoxamine 5'-phosphate oxidase